MLFDSWWQIVRVLIVGVCAYAGLVIVLRATGKRTLTKLNAFDLIVTIALGSTLATILLSRDVTLAEGLTALTLLVLLQYAVSWTCVRFQFLNDIVKSEPRLLYYRGDFDERAMRRERVTQAEVFSAIRGSGISDTNAVEAVVLETSGSMSILKRSSSSGPGGPTTYTLDDVQGQRASSQAATVQSLSSLVPPRGQRSPSSPRRP